jgi:predicted ABC-class ATPase
MGSVDDLKRELGRIDGRGYKAYKDIQGSYRFADFTLFIDHVQGDPFASPSKIRVRVSQDVAKLPQNLFENPVRRIALEDFLARAISRAIRTSAQGRRGTGRSGLVSVDAGGQEVLERTAIVLNQEWVEARMVVGLPAAGRRVLGLQAETMLCSEIPRVVESGLLWRTLDANRAQEFVECVENQEHIRSRLDELDLVAFVADGSILPRESGASDRPLNREKAVPFKSPDSLRVEIELPNPLSGGKSTISGMGIRNGVTLIVGGGFHGKSTLLRALERGVYPHVPSDGREHVVTHPDSVKIRAEGGRRVEKVDISPFISNLPYGRGTDTFSTDDASGSTSQAANIVEALEVGANAILLDEDTSATNFMIRDARMQALVAKENEPITPFLDRVRELYDVLGVSTILVMGGSGDYFEVADTVIMMKDYLPVDATKGARAIADAYRTERKAETPAPLKPVRSRVPLAESFDSSRGRREVKIDAKSLILILFGTDPVDLGCVEQLVDMSQTRAAGYAIHLAKTRFMDGKTTLSQILDSLEDFLTRNGLDALDPFHRNERHPGDFARPRRYEIAAAINRLRTVRMKK